MANKKLLFCGYKNKFNLTSVRFVFQQGPDEHPGRTDYMRDTKKKPSDRRYLKRKPGGGHTVDWEKTKRRGGAIQNPERAALAKNVSVDGGLDNVAEKSVMAVWEKAWAKLEKQGVPKFNSLGVEFPSGKSHYYELNYFLEYAAKNAGKGRGKIRDIRRKWLGKPGKVNWVDFEGTGNNLNHNSEVAKVLDLFYKNDGGWHWANKTGFNVKLGHNFRGAMEKLKSLYLNEGDEYGPGSNLTAEQAAVLADAIDYSRTKVEIVNGNLEDITHPSYAKAILAQMKKQSNTALSSIREDKWDFLSPEGIRAMYKLGIRDAEQFVYRRMGNHVYALYLVNKNGRPNSGQRIVRRFNIGAKATPLPNFEEGGVLGKEHFAGLLSKFNMKERSGPKADKALRWFAKKDLNLNRPHYKGKVDENIYAGAEKANQSKESQKYKKYAGKIDMLAMTIRDRPKDSTGASLAPYFKRKALKAVKVYKKALGKGISPELKALDDNGLADYLVQTRMIPNFDKAKKAKGAVPANAAKMNIKGDELYQFTIDYKQEDGKRALKKAVEKVSDKWLAVQAKLNKVKNSPKAALIALMWPGDKLTAHFMAEVGMTQYTVPKGQPDAGKVYVAKPIKGFGIAAYFLGLGGENKMMAGLAKKFPFILALKKTVDSTIKQVAGMAGVDMKEKQKLAFDELKSIASTGSPIEGDSFDLDGVNNDVLNRMYVKDLKEDWSLNKTVEYRKSGTKEWKRGFLAQAKPGQEIRMSKSFNGGDAPQGGAYMGMEIPTSVSKAPAKPAPKVADVQNPPTTNTKTT